MPRKTGKRVRRLTKYQKCIGKKMKGRRFASRAEVRAAFRRAVKDCK